MSPPPRPAPAPDVRRAMWSLCALGALSVVLAALYANHHAFRSTLVHGLPEVLVPATTLVVAFLVVAGLMLGWALLLHVLGSPSSAAWLMRAWPRAGRTAWTAKRTLGLSLLLAMGYGALRMWANDVLPHATLERLTAGEADLPFQYRALVPWLVYIATLVVPRLPLDVAYGAVEALAAFGFVVAFRALLSELGLRRPGADVAALFGLGLLALNLATPYRFNALRDKHGDGCRKRS